MNPITTLPSGGAALFWGVITFSLLVFLHEGGHFLAARLFRVRVHEFMLGLPGPALRVRSKRSGTAYGVSAFLLGGYVRIAGMEPGSEDDRLAEALGVLIERGHLGAHDLSSALGVPLERAAALLVTLEDYGAARLLEDRETSQAIFEKRAGETDADALARLRSTTFRGLPAWKRISILAMGVLVNIAAAIVILTAALSIVGISTPTLKVAAVSRGGAAETAGVQVGDRIVAFNGKTLADWTALKTMLGHTAPGTAVELLVVRNGSQVDLRATPMAAKEGTGSVLGITAGVRNVPMRLDKAVAESFSLTGQVFVAVGRFFQPRDFASSISNARSVVGISYEVASAAEAGPLAYAWMVALLSLSLGVMNILPLPPLDGGKIALEIVEAVAHRPVPRKVSLALSALGTILLFSLIFYLMYADVLRYIVNRG